MRAEPFLLRAATISAALLVVGRAAADEESLRLAWSAPAGCPSGDEVKRATLRNVDRARVPSGVLVAEASVEQQSPSSWRVRLKTRRGETAGEREIEGPTCAGVADATAVLLALALVPSTAVVEPPTPPPTVTPVTLTPPDEAPPGPPPSTASREEGAHHLAVGIAAAGDLGSMPSAAFGGEASIAWTPGRLRIEADGRILAAQSATIPGNSAGARFSMSSLGGRGCFAILRSAAFDLAPCAGGDVEVMSAEGFGAPTTQTPTKAWAMLAAGGLGRVFLAKWLAIRGRVELDLPLWRPSWDVVGAGTVFHPPTIGAAAYFGAEVLFL